MLQRSCSAIKRVNVSKLSGTRGPSPFTFVKNGVTYSRVYLGAPCRNGHDGTRYLATKNCAFCHRKRRKKDYAQKRDAAAGGVKSMVYELARRATDPKGAWASRRVSFLRFRAAKKHVPFNLDADYLLTLCGNECPVLGVPLEYKFLGHKDIYGPTVDRLKPELGYVPGNVAVISRIANNIKSSATGEQVMAVAKWMESNGL